MQTGNITFGFNLGSATVKVGAYGDAEGTAVDLGRTTGGVEFSIERETKEVETDQDRGPIGAKETKRKGKLKLKMSESSLANLALALNLPTSAVDGSTLSLGADTDGELYRTVYLNVDGPAGGTRKYTFHKCVITGAGQTMFKKDEASSIELQLDVLWDTTQTVGQEMGTVVDTSADTTAPTVALTTPADGGTVTKNTQGTVTWTFTEANAIDESTLVYGKTVLILNDTVRASTALVAGSIVYTKATKTLVFTPTSNWTASDTLQAIVAGVKDVNGNVITAKIEQFSVTA